MRSGHTAEDARTLAFTTLVVGNVALIWANRSARNTVLESRENQNPALWLVTFGSIATLCVVLYVPYLRTLFQLSALHRKELAVALVLGSGSITWFEVLKLVRRKKS